MVIDMEECKEKLEQVYKDVKDVKEFVDEISEDIHFFIENKDKISQVFDMVEKEFSEAKSCPVPVVKVDGECKPTSQLLEPIVGRYIPSDDIFDDIRVLIDAAAVGKLKDKLNELEKYLESVVEGYNSCPIPEDITPVEMKTPVVVKSKEETENIPIDEDAEKEAAKQLILLNRTKIRNETSKRRQWFKECMQEKLSGLKGLNRIEFREKFKEAAKECARMNPYPKK